MIPHRRLPNSLLLAAIAVASLRCSSDSSDPGGQPDSVQEVSGNGQVGLINETLAQPLVVRVEDESGNPLEGVTIQWTIGGGGSLNPLQLVTGTDGLASVERTLGGVAGEQTTTATVEGLPPVVFTSTAEAGSIPQLLIANQPSATAVSGEPLAEQPVIQLEDGTGQPGGAGVEVTASVTGATLSGTATVASDEAGVVRFTDLALTGADGTYTLVFEADGYVGVQSNEVALSGTPVESGRLVVVTQPSTQADNGEALGQQPVVRAEDANGDPLPAGVPVTVSAQGATLTGTTTVESDAEGLAHFTDLALTGPSGDYRLSFSAPDLTGAESDQIELHTTSGESGQWSDVMPWPIVAIHTMLLPTGKVLAINRIQTPQIWDPATESVHDGARAGQSLLRRACPASRWPGLPRRRAHRRRQGAAQCHHVLAGDGAVDLVHADAAWPLVSDRRPSWGTGMWSSGWPRRGLGRGHHPGGVEQRHPAPVARRRPTRSRITPAPSSRRTVGCTSRGRPTPPASSTSPATGHGPTGRPGSAEAASTVRR